MGGGCSNLKSWRKTSSIHSKSSSWDYSQAPYYSHESSGYAPQQPYAQQQPYSSSQDYAPHQYPPPRDYGANKRRLERKYSKIADNYNSIEEVIEALVHAGLDSSNVIVGINFI